MVISFKVIDKREFPKENVFTLECNIPEENEDRKWAKLVYDMETKLNELGFIRVHGDIR